MNVNYIYICTCIRICLKMISVELLGVRHVLATSNVDIGWTLMQLSRIQPCWRRARTNTLSLTCISCTCIIIYAHIDGYAAHTHTHIDISLLLHIHPPNLVAATSPNRFRFLEPPGFSKGHSGRIGEAASQLQWLSGRVFFFHIRIWGFPKMGVPQNHRFQY